MKIALTVTGWLLTAAGIIMFLIIAIDGVHLRDNAILITPTATLIVAGAIFVLASVLVDRRPPTPPTVPGTDFHQRPPAPQYRG